MPRACSAFLGALCAGLSVAPLLAEDPVMLDAVEVPGEVPRYSIQTAPMTVTDYSGDFLKETGVSGYEQLAPFVPGLFVSEQSVANSSYNIRGITTDNGDPRGTQRVSVFQDNIPLSNNATINVALFDLDRVDIVKGPQASAFSRATQIGAVSTVSARARNETSAEFTAGFGDYGTRLAGGYVNAPVIADKLFARVAFSAQTIEGYVDNLADDSHLQGKESFAVRSSVRWQPSAQTTADFIVGFQRDTPPGVAFKSMVVPTSEGSTSPFDPAELNRGSDLGADRKIVSLTGIVTHQLNENWKVASTTGWRDTDAEEEFDADGSQFYLLEAGEYTRARQFTQELRFTYDSHDRLRGSIGATLFWEKATQTIPFRTNQQQLYAIFSSVNPALPPPMSFPDFPLLPTYYEEKFTNSAETLSTDLFGEVDYKVTRRLTLGANVRIARERLTSGYDSRLTSTPNTVSFPFLPTAGGGNSFFAPTGGQLESTATHPSWVGGINAAYELTPRHTAYATISRGRLAPKTTQSQFPGFALVKLKEEEVWNYEVGLKGLLANHRVSYDVAFFHYAYDHFQTQQTVGPGVVAPTDAGRATAKGFETTLNVRANDHVTFFGTYGFTDAEFENTGEDGNPQVFAGNTFRLTSRHTFSLGATFTLPVDAVGTFYFTPVWQYRSEHFFEDDNTASGGTLRQDGFGLVHLRAGYRTPNDRWEVSVWVRNLLDEDYLIDAGNIGGDFGFPTAIRGAPRMMGVNVTARF